MSLFVGVFSLAHQFLSSESSDLPTRNRRLTVKVLGDKWGRAGGVPPFRTSAFSQFTCFEHGVPLTPLCLEYQMQGFL